MEMREKIHDTEPIRFAILAADTVVFTVRNGELRVRLIKIDRPPFFKNAKGLPGGLLDPKESAEQAAFRHTEHKANIAASKMYMEQLYTFSEIERDPRGRVVAVAYLALVPWERLSPAEQNDTPDVWWCPIKKARKLAYDHDEILSLALKRLHSRITYTTLLSKLMPKEFTLTELEGMYESVLGADLDKRNFRKKIMKLNIVTPTKSKRTGGRFRPAQLYRFASEAVEDIAVL
jgi:8-oxo-dGTP diphosphatase